MRYLDFSNLAAISAMMSMDYAERFGSEKPNPYYPEKKLREVNPNPYNLPEFHFDYKDGVFTCHAINYKSALNKFNKWKQKLNN